MELGHPVDLLALGRRRSDRVATLPGAENARQLFTGGMSSLPGWLTIVRAVRRSRPDIVICVNQTPLVICAVVRLLTIGRYPLVCIFHTTILRPGNSPDRKHHRFFELAVRACHLVFVSRNQQRYWLDQGLKPARSSTIENGIELEHFRPDETVRARQREGLGVAVDDILVGISASLWAEKNHAMLMDAVERLRRSGRPVRLLIVGDGPTKEAILARIEGPGGRETFIFAGEQQDVWPWLCACDVGVICSTAVETFSLAALEFLATGVPMVMTDIGGASEIVQPGVNGLLVPPDDLDALVSALTELCDPLARASMSGQARRSVQRFDTATMVGRYHELVQSLAPRAAPGRHASPAS